MDGMTPLERALLEHVERLTLASEQSAKVQNAFRERLERQEAGGVMQLLAALAQSQQQLAEGFNVYLSDKSKLAKTQQRLSESLQQVREIAARLEASGVNTNAMTTEDGASDDADPPKSFRTRRPPKRSGTVSQDFQD